MRLMTTTSTRGFRSRCDWRTDVASSLTITGNECGSTIRERIARKSTLAAGKGHIRKSAVIPRSGSRKRLANESRARSRILGHWPFGSLGRPTCVFVLRQNFMCQAHTGKGRRESEKYNALSNSTRLRDHALAGLDQSRWRNNLAFRYAIRHRPTTAIIGRHRHHHHHRRCPCRRRCPRLLANRLHTCKASIC